MSETISPRGQYRNATAPLPVYRMDANNDHREEKVRYTAIYKQANFVVDSECPEIFGSNQEQNKS